MTCPLTMKGMKATFGLHEEKQGRGKSVLGVWFLLRGIHYAHVIVERRTPVRHSMGHVAA